MNKSFDMDSSSDLSASYLLHSSFRYGLDKHSLLFVDAHR